MGNHRSNFLLFINIGESYSDLQSALIFIPQGTWKRDSIVKHNAEFQLDKNSK